MAPSTSNRNSPRTSPSCPLADSGWTRRGTGGHLQVDVHPVQQLHPQRSVRSSLVHPQTGLNRLGSTPRSSQSAITRFTTALATLSTRSARDDFGPPDPTSPRTSGRRSMGGKNRSRFGRRASPPPITEDEVSVAFSRSTPSASRRRDRPLPRTRGTIRPIQRTARSSRGACAARGRPPPGGHVRRRPDPGRARDGCVPGAQPVSVVTSTALAARDLGLWGEDMGETVRFDAPVVGCCRRPA